MVVDPSLVEDQRHGAERRARGAAVGARGYAQIGLPCPRVANALYQSMLFRIALATLLAYPCLARDPARIDQIVQSSVNAQHFMGTVLLARDGQVLFSKGRSEERRVGKECRSRWSPYH